MITDHIFILMEVQTVYTSYSVNKYDYEGQNEKFESQRGNLKFRMSSGKAR